MNDDPASINNSPNPKDSESDQQQEWDMSDVLSWDEIKKAREEREKEGKEISVFWANDTQLQVSVGGERELLTPEEAIKKYNNNPDFMLELNYLLSPRPERLEPNRPEGPEPNRPEGPEPHRPEGPEPNRPEGPDF